MSYLKKPADIILTEIRNTIKGHYFECEYTIEQLKEIPAQYNHPIHCQEIVQKIIKILDENTVTKERGKSQDG